MTPELFCCGFNMNIAVLIYSPSSEQLKNIKFGLKGMRPRSTEMHLCSRESFVIQLHLQK